MVATPRPFDRAALRALVVGAAITVGALSACESAPACSPGVSPDAAQGIARDLAVSGQPPEMTIAEIASKPYPERPTHGSAWTIQVDATGIYHQSTGPVTTLLHWLIDVDMGTGNASIVAQG